MVQDLSRFNYLSSQKASFILLRTVDSPGAARSLKSEVAEAVDECPCMHCVLCCILSDMIPICLLKNRIKITGGLSLSYL